MVIGCKNPGQRRLCDRTHRFGEPRSSADRVMYLAPLTVEVVPER
jgi:hypothetical protein